MTDAHEKLLTIEEHLDPSHPERIGVEVLAYGEISAALLIPQLPGMVAKRMTGFLDDVAVEQYVSLVDSYVGQLRAAGVSVVDTECVAVRPPGRPRAVYLVQPRMPHAGLGDRLLHGASDDDLGTAIRAILDRVWRLHAVPSGDEIAVDAQVSNWWFEDLPEPVLLDVGTPFLRTPLGHEFDPEIVLSAVPPGIRAAYRAKGTAVSYMNDYFVPRLAAIDMLGNFGKEGAHGRMPLGIRVVNEWLLDHGDRQTDPTEVEEYYRKDAAQLELFHKVRRLDRFVRTKVLKQRYEFILPGPVQR